MGYILITGGNLINKGAQAMTFIAVDEIKRRFPDREVVVISDVDAARSDEELSRYRFLFRDSDNPMPLLDPLPLIFRYHHLSPPSSPR